MAAPLPEFCLCIHAALAGVTPSRRYANRRSCPRCAPYTCDSVAVRHPTPATLRERLHKAPYFIAGKRNRVLAQKIAREASVARLREAWKRDAALKGKGYTRVVQPGELGWTGGTDGRGAMKRFGE